MNDLDPYTVAGAFLVLVAVCLVLPSLMLTISDKLDQRREARARRVAERERRVTFQAGTQAGFDAGWHG